ncbi:MAG: hypothetical protein U0324_24505 [Polyangiales bacterium]
MTTREHLLGFDCRVIQHEAQTAWDPARRERFLLRLDVEQVYSTDRYVWPSPFAADRSGSWTGLGLWANLDDLRHELNVTSGLPPVAVIAISVFERPGVAPPALQPPVQRVTPDAPAPDWSPLGYDVADAGLMSGLSNCGYAPHVAARLRTQWASRLTRHHLIADPSDADALLAMTERRVAGHAPFFVYRIHQIA